MKLETIMDEISKQKVIRTLLMSFIRKLSNSSNFYAESDTEPSGKDERIQNGKGILLVIA